MPSERPTVTIWQRMADKIGCDIATIKAVFEVEAAGKFYEANGKLPRRFEPHHFPKQFWGRLGFAPGSKAPWRASLALRTSKRRAMFDQAEQIDHESAYKAASWAAPQIMGFNHSLAGHSSATNMVAAMETSADAQIEAFTNFVISAGLDGHLRSQNWHGFAAGYNGNGQAAVYAGKIESAYRRQSGGTPSAKLLRVGMSGQTVMDFQLELVGQGYDITADGIYGAETLNAVREFQAAEGLKVDGIAGAATQRAIVAAGGEPLHLARSEKPATAQENTIDKVIGQSTAILGSGGAVTLLTQLDDMAQTLLIGGLVFGAVAVAVLYVLRKTT